MSFSEMEVLREELGLGVNAFLRLTGTAKSTYYRRKRGGKARTTCQEAVEGEVKRLCDEHPRLGHRPIHALLTKAHPSSPSTVYRVMKRFDLCQKPQKKKPVKSSPAPLELDSLGLTVGLDFTHWDKKPILNVLEYESRYCLASVESERETSEAAKDALHLALQEAQKLGLPHRNIEVKSDHGSPFTAETFRTFLYDNRCQHTLSAVGRPQGMGRVERFNRSLKEQGLQPEELASGQGLQPLLDTYRSYYNTRRPHQALGYKTPLELLKSKGYNSVPLI
jgi:transposase InsO family protein